MWSLRLALDMSWQSLDSLISSARAWKISSSIALLRCSMCGRRATWDKNPQTRELISARQMSHKHNNKWHVSKYKVNLNSSRGTSLTRNKVNMPFKTSSHFITMLISVVSNVCVCVCVHACVHACVCMCACVGVCACVCMLLLLLFLCVCLSVCFVVLWSVSVFLSACVCLCETVRKLARMKQTLMMMMMMTMTGVWMRPITPFKRGDSTHTNN